MSMPWRTDLESSAPDDSTPEGLRSNDTVVCNMAVVDARRNLKYIQCAVLCMCRYNDKCTCVGVCARLVL